MKFLYVATLFSPKIQGSIISSRSRLETLRNYQSTLSKNWWFFALLHNSDNPQFPKTAFNIDTGRYSIFFQQLLVRFLPLGPRSKHHILEEDVIKKLSCSFMCQVLHFPEFPKKGVNLDLARFSNSNFSDRTALISSNKVSIECLTFVEEHSFEKSLILILASASKKSENSKKCYY